MLAVTFELVEQQDPNSMRDQQECVECAFNEEVVLLRTQIS